MVGEDGEGNVVVSFDGGETQVSMRREDVQRMVDLARAQRWELLLDNDEQEEAKATGEDVSPVEGEAVPFATTEGAASRGFELNDVVEVRGENGQMVQGYVTRPMNEDGLYEVFTDSSVGGLRSAYYAPEDMRLVEAKGVEGLREGAQEGEDGTLQGDDVQPSGRGVMGNIYDLFRGKAKEAVDFLMRKKEGVAVGALHHREVGDIDLWWGNEKAGLMKIARKHPEVLDNLQGVLDGMRVVQASDNRIILESDTHKAVVSNNWLGEKIGSQWLLTAYEKKGTDTSGGSIDIVPEPNGKQNGTAPLQDVVPSDGKDSVSSDNGQGNVGENVIEMPMRRVKRKIEGQVMEVDEEDFEAVSPERTADYLYNEEQSGISREQADDFVGAKIAENEKVVKGIEARKPRKGASPAEIRVHKGKVAAELAEAVPGLEYWRAVAAARDAVKEREIAAANERYRQERAAKEEAKRAAEVQRKEDVETLQNAEQGDNRTSSRMAIPASSDGKVNTSSNSKQGNVNESKGKAQKAFSYFNGSMEELIGKSSDKTANDKKVVSVVSEQLRNDLSAQGLEIGEDYKHVVDVSGIRHTMKQHGHIKEKKRGQVPIEAKDFALIENVVSSYDDVVVEQTKSTPIIKYKKRLDDGTIVYVEEVRMGRGELALKTMYKQKGSSLTDENLQMPVSDTPVATSDLDASDGKVSTSSEKEKRKAQKKTSNGDKPAFVGLDAFTEQRMAEELEKSGYASLEDWEIEEPDAFVTVYDNVGKEYASYVSRLAEEGTLQEVYDKSSVKTQNKIRKEIEFAGFDYHDLLDTSPNRVKRQDYLEGGAKYARGTFLDGRVVEGEIVEQSPTSITILENGRRYTIKASDVLVRSNEPLSSDESLSAKIAAAEDEVDTNPSEGQKEAGNYKKGHIRIGAFDISIEQPKGSVRRGVDANGKAWESKMHNTYGYFRGTEGVDGDHIDVFVSNDIDGWNGQKVFVVDQYNPDGTFDEHKVMLGFNDAEDAKSDYIANYEKGWEDGRRLDVSATSLEDFEKWLASSHRKTKPFAEYKGVKREVDEVDAALKKELQDFIAQTDTMGRTAMDESGYDAEELFAPLLLDGKPSPLAVMTSVSDDINDPSVQIAVYDYSQEIDEKTNSGWQKWGNLADEYNAQAAEEDKGWERGDTALLGFRSVDAAVRFYDWVQHRDGVQAAKQLATDVVLSLLESADVPVEVVSDEVAAVLPEHAQLHMVYHGSGAKFDKFDHSHMGEGEGAQAYGWGSYVTEVEGIGRTYAKAMLADKYKENRIVNQLVRERLESDGSKEESLKYLKSLLEEGWSDKKRVRKQIKIIETGKYLPEGKTHLYTVEIPDDKGKNYLYWDQSVAGKEKERIRVALTKAVIGRLEASSPSERQALRTSISAEWHDISTGQEVYSVASRYLSPMEASGLLSSLGYTGISHAAQVTAGGRADGARNYVIFNEHDLKITNHVEFMKTSQGTVYGWTVDGKIYLTRAGLNPETPIHE